MKRFFFHSGGVLSAILRLSDGIMKYHNFAIENLVHLDEDYFHKLIVKVYRKKYDPYVIFGLLKSIWANDKSIQVLTGYVEMLNINAPHSDYFSLISRYKTQYKAPKTINFRALLESNLKIIGVIQDWSDHPLKIDRF